MPTFQGERYLKDALESVRRQHPGHLLELIAVDDGSTDATLDILKRAGQDVPIRIIEHRNGNWVAGTNAGLEAARGEFVSFLHQDDLWYDGCLSERSRLREMYADADFITHPSIFVGPDGRRLGRWSFPFGRNRSGIISRRRFLEVLLVQNVMAIPSVTFRRSLFRDVGRMAEDMWFLSDWQYWARLGAAAREIVVSPKFLSAFRLHAGSQTLCRSDREDDLRSQYRRVANDIKELLGDDLRVPSSTVRASRAGVLNAEVSIALATMHHGKRPGWGGLFRLFLGSSPLVWHRFLRDSRISERTVARLRLNRKGR